MKKNNFTFAITLLIFTLLTTGCDLFNVDEVYEPKTKTVLFTIAPTLEQIVTTPPDYPDITFTSYYMIATENGTTEPIKIYNIDGFTFEEGYRYEIKMKIISHPIIDDMILTGQRKRDWGHTTPLTFFDTYELVEVVSKVKVFEADRRLNVQYLRRFGHYQEIRQPIVSVISTKSELEQYYESRVKCIYNSNTGSFLEATKIYADSFFANNFLVIVLLEEGSGSIRHQVERINENGDIVINRLIPQFGTADMAEWNIIIELDNNIKMRQFNAVFVDKVYK